MIQDVRKTLVNVKHVKTITGAITAACFVVYKIASGRLLFVQTSQCVPSVMMVNGVKTVNMIA